MSWWSVNRGRLWSVHSRKRGLTRKPGPPVHDDLVTRQFAATRPAFVVAVHVLRVTVVTITSPLMVRLLQSGCSSRAQRAGG